VTHAVLCEHSSRAAASEAVRFSNFRTGLSMDEITVTETIDPEIESKHDPLMTAFVGMIIGLLLLFAVLILIANGRMPDNL